MNLRPDFPVHIQREQKMSLLSIELSQERIREAERDAARREAIARARASRRIQRDAPISRFRRLLTWR